MNGYRLPMTAEIGGKLFHLRSDFRNVLEVFSWLERQELPQYLRWRVAVELFYEETVEKAQLAEATQYLAWFLRAGEEESNGGPRLFSWQQDARHIIAGVNKAAGQELRQEPFVHWWTFLSWFHAMGEGSFLTLVSIRDKLARGKKLESWEQEFYRQNKDQVILKRREDPFSREEKERLLKRLDA